MEVIIFKVVQEKNWILKNMIHQYVNFKNALFKNLRDKL